MIQLVVGLSRAMIRDQTLRRQTMFYVVLVALVMLFAGSTFLAIDPREHPLVFLIFWAACGWLTILAVLLAIFDLLMIRAAARAARRELEKTYLETEEGD